MAKTSPTSAAVAYLQSDPDSDGGLDNLPIGKILDKLHAGFPEYNFPKFRSQLIAHGIHYLLTASLFNPQFYIENVGMNHGQSAFFCLWVEKEMKKVREDKEQRMDKGKKRARVINDENVG